MASTIYEPLQAAIGKGEAEYVDAQEIVRALGSRAFGLSVMIIVAPVCLPMPPGVPTVAGVILGFFAAQMMLGFSCPWIAGPMLRLTIRQIRTKPYTPNTNGKAERFIQTALTEWAYARV